MAEYTYKKIQKMREFLREELMSSGMFPMWNIECEKILESRLQTALMAGVLEGDVTKDIKIRN